MPFGVHVFEGLLEQELASLAAAFPVTARQRPSAGSDKDYDLSAMPLIARGRELDSLLVLEQQWRHCCSTLLSQSFAALWSELCGQAVGPENIDVGIFEYGPGQYISPHTDKPQKLYTHIFYLNDAWPRSWGGRLVMLRSKDMEDEFCSLTPKAPASVGICRSDRSWHAVERVSEYAATRRRTLQVEVWRA